MDWACPDDEEYEICARECEELKRRGWGPEYEECIEECYHKYQECDYDDWVSS